LSIVYAFVFARGGSKGLPRKNALELGGIPLIAHSILKAKQVSAISKVFVSTDDPELTEVAQRYGAQVIERPAELATDTSSELDAWRHAVEFLVARGERFDVFVSLPATSPLRSVRDIQDCIDALDEKSDTVITVTAASRNPYFNMVIKNSDGSCEIMNKSEDGYSRRQDAPEVFDITTVAYALRPDHILAGRGVLQGRVRSVEIPRERAVDIDDIWDFKLAEVIFKMKKDSTDA
jgi:CMP-N-acetylneuraminic acid synthetase